VVAGVEMVEELLELMQHLLQAVLEETITLVLVEVHLLLLDLTVAAVEVV
jgi:hypothetical protein